MNHFSIRVAIADDHPAVLIGLQQVLEHAGQIELVGTCRNSTQIVELLQHVACDVVICEYTLPEGKYRDGLEFFGYLQRNFPDIGIVVLTTMNNRAVVRTLASQGNLSVISKADATGHIITAIHATVAGGNYHSPTIRSIASNVHSGAIHTATELSPKEAEVMRLLASGNTVTDIAAYLKRSKQTISSHKRSAMRKFGASNDIELISFMLSREREIAPLVIQPENPASTRAMHQDLDAR
ncbi:response regulator containing a CheY-like receiver domain and an HTH DNA-binding domain [Burkholderia sp. Ch1-1]|uniref:Response regulator containing a CheY-like receiver domain and an HTH DNA-binding domain n=2 Tax=Burkholderiaceae TaxID=119060 RepID=A0A5Q4ZEQ0_9BURK|nr:response regulator containing a CheY-like receiver domain and an HTH DNA-binding domain [Burkholderia sp. Ch1-1]VVD29909.1 Response regulator containing a CheY-like receiver domain and an HTH DNA-binding domain [Paraburkholderia dioscoreae]